MLPRPYGNTILVKTEQRPTERKVGSLHVVETATEAPLTGEVIAVGRSVSEILIGGKVLFSRYAGTVVELEGIKYHVLRADPERGDILLVWPPALSGVNGVKDDASVQAS